PGAREASPRLLRHRPPGHLHGRWRRGPPRALAASAARGAAPRYGPRAAVREPRRDASDRPEARALQPLWPQPGRCGRPRPISLDRGRMARRGTRRRAGTGRGGFHHRAPSDVRRHPGRGLGHARSGVDHLELRGHRPGVPSLLSDTRSPRTGSCVTELDRAARRSAAGTLVLLRVVYAFNWYNVGAVLPLIGTGLSANTGQLGIVLGAFLVGAGVFQVPAGLIAMRWGYRTTSIFALALMGSFSLASAFS